MSKIEIHLFYSGVSVSFSFNCNVFFGLICVGFEQPRTNEFILPQKLSINQQLLQIKHVIYQLVSVLFHYQ